MKWAIEEGETSLRFVSKFAEYGIAVDDGGSSSIQLNYCPWCGNRLPESKRTEWFERLEALKIDPLGEEIPHDFQSDAWYAGDRTQGA